MNSDVSQRASEQRPGGHGRRPGAGALLGRGGVDVAPGRGEALLGDGLGAHGLHWPRQSPVVTARTTAEREEVRLD